MAPVGRCAGRTWRTIVDFTASAVFVHVLSPAIFARVSNAVARSYRTHTSANACHRPHPAGRFSGKIGCVSVLGRYKRCRLSAQLIQQTRYRTAYRDPCAGGNAYVLPSKIDVKLKSQSSCLPPAVNMSRTAHCWFARTSRLEGRYVDGDVEFLRPTPGGSGIGFVRLLFRPFDHPVRCRQSHRSYHQRRDATTKSA